MPIRLNLLAEQQEAEEARRRDPVKRSLWIAGLLIGVVIFWSIMLFINNIAARSRLRSQETTFANLQPSFAEATNTLGRLSDIEYKIHALQSYASNRFLWGNALSAAQYSVVDDAQISRISSQQDFKKGEEARTNTYIQITAYMRGNKLVTPLAGITNNITGRTTLITGNTNTSYSTIEINPITLNWWQFKTPPALTNSTKVTAEKTAVVREQIRLLIDGKVYGDSPIKVADRLKAAILTNAYFSKVLRPGGVNFISGLDSPSLDDKETNRLSSPFSMECLFQERIRR